MRPLLGFALALLLSLAPIGAHAQVPPTAATVLRVIDGDTLDVQLEDGTRARVRVIGLDTPETVDPRKPVQCFGREASNRAKELLPPGLVVTLEEDPTQDTRDRYGRALRHVLLDLAPGVFGSFAHAMIAEGYAYHYVYGGVRSARADDYDTAQLGAVMNELGLWNPSACAGVTAGKNDLDATGSTLAGYAGPFDPSGDDRDCGHFQTWDEAQAFFLAAGDGDPHKLDADQDGIACESLATAAGVPAIAAPPAAPAAVAPTPRPLATARPVATLVPAPLPQATLQPTRFVIPPAATATPAPSGFEPSRYLGQGDRFNCGDFRSQADAQAVLRADPRDPNRLDGNDQDGIACESNAAPRDTIRVTR